MKYVLSVLLVLAALLHPFDGAGQTGRIDRVKVAVLKRGPQKGPAGDSVTVGVSFSVNDWTNLKKMRLSYGPPANAGKAFATEYTYWAYGPRKYLEAAGIMYFVGREGVNLYFTVPASQLGTGDQLTIEGKDKANKRLFLSSHKPG